MIVEDEVIIAETLKRELQKLGYPDATRCKVPHEAEELLKSAAFDLAILDINLAGEREGIGLGHLCNELNVPFFYLTSYSDITTIQQAKESRPGNFLIKPFSSEEIMVAIEMTLMHQLPKDNSKLQKAVTAFGLTKRETEVLSLVYERRSYEEIGIKLFLSKNTVKSHIKNLYFKIGVASKKELIDLVQEL